MEKENIMPYKDKDIVFSKYHKVPRPITQDMVDLLDKTGFFDPPIDDITPQDYIETHRVVDVYCQSLCLVNEIHNRFMTSLCLVLLDYKERSEFIDRYLIYAFCPSVQLRDALASVYYGGRTLGNFYHYNICDGSGSDEKEVEELMKKVRFNCAVGNPSYKNDLYLEFIKAGHKMASDYSLWITPAKWHMEDDSDFYENMGFDMSEVKFIDKISDVFEDMDLQGRLAYYLCEKNYGEN